MGHDDKTVKPPPFALLATEGRGLLDIAALLAAAPFLAAPPRGQPLPKASAIRSMAGAVVATCVLRTPTFRPRLVGSRSSGRTPA
jgi:hypothetical protein